jgi:hypothetical protein
VDAGPFLVVDVENFDARTQWLVQAGVELDFSESQAERQHRPKACACGE